MNSKQFRLWNLQMALRHGLSSTLLVLAFVGGLFANVAPVLAAAPANNEAVNEKSSEKTLAQLDEEVRQNFRKMGRKVQTGVIRVDNRKDWMVDFEFISGDPKQPLIVLANGFIWPRENSAPFWAALGAQSMKKKGPAYNLLRFDMSGQGRTIERFKKDGPAPWYMHEPMTVEKLRKEMSTVIRTVLRGNRLSPNQPIILMGLSYGRAILPEDLSEQTKLVVEIAPMMRSMAEYQDQSVMWRNSLNWMRLNPFLAPMADQMQRDGWHRFYNNFYSTNPDRMPPNVVPEWYAAGSALRTNAVEGYQASQHIIEGVPHLLFVAEVDDVPLKRDQLVYFRDALSRKAPSTMVYMRKTAHGMTANPVASHLIVELITKAIVGGKVGDGERVMEFDVIGDKMIFRRAQLEQLMSEQRGAGAGTSGSMGFGQ